MTGGDKEDRRNVVLAMTLLPGPFNISLRFYSPEIHPHRYM